MTTDTSGHEMALAQAEAMIERQADEIARLRDENESLRGSLEEWKLDLNSLRDELENLRQPAKWRTCATHGDDKPNVWGCPECLRELRDENARLRDDQEECDALRTKLADILTRTANALKGEPGELQAHSWHDLPEWAQRLRKDAERLDWMSSREAWIGWTRDSELCRVLKRDEDGDTYPVCGWDKFFGTARDAIDAAMQKGE